jgi:hypothetical protein
VTWVVVGALAIANDSESELPRCVEVSAKLALAVAVPALVLLV